MPPKARNKQEELTAYNRPQSEWIKFFKQLSLARYQFVLFNLHTEMDRFESMFDVDDLGEQLSARKFDANLPLELLKLDAMVVSVVDWYPSNVILSDTLITPAVQARRDLIRTFVTPMCDLFKQLHSADEHEDLQLLLLAAMASLAHYNCEKIVRDELFAVAAPTVLNIHGNSAAILAKVFHLMTGLCGSCLRPDVYLLVMENETMLLSAFKTMATAPPEAVVQGRWTDSCATQAVNKFVSFLHFFATTCLAIPELVAQMFPLLATLVEVAPEHGKVATLKLIAKSISKQHYDCWLSLPHLKSTVQTALDFEQWDVVDRKSGAMVPAAMYVVNQFMEHAPSDEAALAVGNKLSNGRLVEVCKTVLVCIAYDALYTAASILSRLVSMNTVSLTDCGLLPTLMASISKFPHETCAVDLLCELAPMDNVDAIEYLLSCGVLSLITRCFQGGLARMKQLQWALSFLEEVIDAYGEEYFEGESATDSWHSLDFVVPYQFPFMLFLKEQHEVIGGLKHVVETFPAGEEEQFHERARALLKDIGDIV